MKGARFDARKKLPVIDGFAGIAEQEIDQKIFILYAVFCGKGGRRRILPGGAVKHALKLLRQMLHIVENHPAREKPAAPVPQPRQTHQTPVLVSPVKKAVRQNRNQRFARFIKQPLDITARAVRFIPLSTYFSETKVEDYGSSVAHIFNFEVF